MFQTLSEAFEGAEQGNMVKSLQCEDFKEGVAHFLEKRAAAFTVNKDMHFDFSEKVQTLQKRLQHFMDEHVYPNEHRHHEELEPKRPVETVADY